MATSSAIKDKFYLPISLTEMGVDIHTGSLAVWASGSSGQDVWQNVLELPCPVASVNGNANVSGATQKGQLTLSGTLSYSIPVSVGTHDLFLQISYSPDTPPGPAPGFTGQWGYSTVYPFQSTGTGLKTLTLTDEVFEWAFYAGSAAPNPALINKVYLNLMCDDTAIADGAAGGTSASYLHRVTAIKVVNDIADLPPA
jgi:hypothetical protein